MNDNETETVFKVGDRVVAIAPVDDYANLIGLRGEVVHVSGNWPPIGVQFDTYFRGGHDCNKHGEPGRCRYGEASSFEIESDVEICLDSEEIILLDNFLESYKH